MAFVLLVLLLGLLLSYPRNLGTWGPILAFTVFALVIIAWARDRSSKQRSRYESRLESWAQERAVTEERLKIARELHDLASHGLGVMTVRAATAKLADDQERLVALDDIERVGRRSTQQLRTMLTLLRTADADTPMHPLGGTDDLQGLVENMRSAGLRIDLEFDDDPLEPLSPEFRVTVCAVVHEALSNTLRHAGHTQAHVKIRARDDDGITIDIHDEGPTPGWEPHPGTGHGLSGLRERLSLYDGTLTVAPVGTGFRLLAYLPTTRAS